MRNDGARGKMEEGGERIEGHPTRITLTFYSQLKNANAHNVEGGDATKFRNDRTLISEVG